MLSFIGPCSAVESVKLPLDALHLLGDQLLLQLRQATPIH